jgi:DNA invertase Pin-like site-specific DNA recombinase
MMEFAREGDEVHVESVSRLARSTRDLLDIVDRLTKRGVTFVSNKESFDTKTATGRFVLTIFSALATLERETNLERQREGIAAARLRGRHLGRPSAGIPAGFHEIVARWRSREITAVSAMKELRLSKTRFYELAKSVA